MIRLKGTYRNQTLELDRPSHSRMAKSSKLTSARRRTNYAKAGPSWEWSVWNKTGTTRRTRSTTIGGGSMAYKGGDVILIPFP